MDSLLQMVSSGLPGLTEQGLSPQYFIKAMVAGAAALRGSKVWLAALDIVYLRTDKHVQAWVLLNSNDLLNLLVIAKRAEADPLSPQANAREGAGCGRGGAAGGEEQGEMLL